MISSNGPNRRIGIEAPVSEKPTAPRSKMVPLRSAEIMPTETPISSQTTAAPNTMLSVTGRVRPMMSATGSSLRNE